MMGSSAAICDFLFFSRLKTFLRSILTSEMILKAKQPLIPQVIDISALVLSPCVLCDSDKQKLEKGDAISHEI